MDDSKHLRELLNYDPETGVFSWKKRVSNRIKVGEEAGYIRQCGNQLYKYISAFGSQQPAHRLAWLYMTGEWPKDEIDHRDSNGLNNSWNNLRRATRSQNGMNKGPQANNKLGLKGVCKQTKSNRYMARVARTYLGTFDTPEEAHAAYVEAAKRYYGEYARSV